MSEIWFLYALASVVSLGFTTIVDKLMLEKRLSAFSYFVSYVPPALTFSIAVLLYLPTSVFSRPYAIAFAAGAISAAGFFTYARTMRRREASRIAALTSLSPAFVAVLAVFLLDEVLSSSSYLGVALMIAGSALIGYKRKSEQKLIPASLVVMLISANFFFGLEQTFSKISLNEISFWPFEMMFLFGRFAIVFPALALPQVRRKAFSEVKQLQLGPALTLASASIMWTLGIVCFFYAASLGPITLVSATVLISPLVTLLFAILITKYLPGVLKEEIDTGTIALKLIAIILIVVGTYIMVP